MITAMHTDSPKTLGFKMSGKLHDEDYRSFVPIVEAVLAKEGKLRLLLQFEDFHGWDWHAAWDDFKFGRKHYSDFDRIAMVGERQWEKWLAQLGKPFTKATIRYFHASRIDDAWTWLREGIEKPQANVTAG
jgi:hypothetical protein